VPRTKREQLRRYLNGSDLDSDLDAGGTAGDSTIERLPYPLPLAVRRVAMVQLCANALWLATVALALTATAIAIVIMPFVLGRQGVGMAMVSLFGLSVTAVFSTLPFFAARGAARILRRERRGIAPVYRLAWITIGLAIPAGFAGALALNFVGPSVAADQPLSPQSQIFLIVLAAFTALAALTIVIFHAYQRVLPAASPPLGNVEQQR
jgi:hypothetical protein